MDQVEVEITSLAITSRYGALAEGTILRTDAAYAAHLVGEAYCAKYTAARAAQDGPALAAETPAAPIRATRGPRGAKPLAKVDEVAAVAHSAAAGADHADQSAETSPADATGTAIEDPAAAAAEPLPALPAA